MFKNRKLLIVVFVIFVYLLLLKFFSASDLKQFLIEKAAIEYGLFGSYSLLNSSQQYKNDTTEKPRLDPEMETFLEIQLNPTRLCESKFEFVFVYVFVAASNFKRRETIRQTWAKKDSLKQIKVAFIIGKSNIDAVEAKLKNEQKKHKDLIQGNFNDTYKTLSYKSLIAWKWINNHCSNAKYVIKVDDDVTLNTFALTKSLKSSQVFYSNLLRSDFHNSFLCKYWVDARPDTNPNSKFYVVKEEFNEKLYGRELYPTYCAGMGFILSTDLVTKLVLKAPEFKVFWIDDVYVGIVSYFLEAKFYDGTYLHAYKGSLDQADFERFLFVNDCFKDEDITFVWKTITDKLANTINI